MTDLPKAITTSPTWLAMPFRPLFLVAAVYAVVSMAIWLVALHGASTPLAGPLPRHLWHAHELLFGFCLAVVAGFLLTAARHWTGRSTVHGYRLLALVVVWCVSRTVMLVPGLPPVLVAVGALAFPITLTVVFAWVSLAAAYARGYPIVALLAAMTAMNALVLAAGLGLVTFAASRFAVHAMSHLLVVLCVVIAGRVVPMFTKNRTGAAVAPSARLGLLAVVLTLVTGFVASVAATWPNDWVRLGLLPFAVLTAVVHLARQSRWAPRAALRVPMLAVLHVAYAWIALGYVLIASAGLTTRLSYVTALHALTVGVLSTLVLGMMSRVTLGHTGREIRATIPLKLSFVLLNVAALARVLADVFPSATLVAWMVSGSLFCAGFVLYLVTSARKLLTRRPDGRAG